MELEVIKVAATILGAFVTLAVPISGAAFYIGRVVGKNTQSRTLERRAQEIHELTTTVGQKDRQIGDLNNLVGELENDPTEDPDALGDRNEINQSIRFLSVYGNSVWLSKAIDPPKELTPGDLKIVTFANNKGGVGKTTLASNFAAFLHQQSKRVLLVDMDYQGSMTIAALAATTTSPGHGIEDQEQHNAYEWLDENSDENRFVKNLTKLETDMPNEFRILETSYNLPTEEDRHLFLWLTGESESDVRFRLRKLLWSETIKDMFDYVIIDAPPKLSLGSVNALTSSTHFVIPTILDRLSSSPIRLLLSSYAGLFNKLDHKPKLAGVAPMKTRQRNLNAEEKRSYENLDSLLSKEGHSASVYETHIPFSVRYARTAGVSFALNDSQLRPRLMRLFEEILKSIK